jgi:hypothetical protein
VSAGWSLGLLFDYHGDDYPQPMLNLASPYKLNENKVEISSPHVSTYPASPSLSFTEILGKTESPCAS